MKRRDFIMGSLGAAAPCSVAAAAQGYRYKGRVTARTCGGHRHRAWLDGREVSSDCEEADDREGYAVLLQRNEFGKHYADGQTGGLAREVRRGVVRIECMDSPCGHCDL